MDCQYTIPLEGAGAPEGEGPADDGQMSVTIAVRPTEEQKEADEKAADKKEASMGKTEGGGSAAPAKKRSTAGSSASSRHGQASAAREYLDEHNLVEFTQLLVQSVIKEQPDRPYAFMARQFYFPDPKPRPHTSPAQDGAKRGDLAPLPEGDENVNNATADFVAEASRRGGRSGEDQEHPC